MWIRPCRHCQNELSKAALDFSVDCAACGWRWSSDPAEEMLLAQEGILQYALDAVLRIVSFRRQLRSRSTATAPPPATDGLSPVAQVPARTPRKTRGRLVPVTHRPLAKELRTLWTKGRKRVLLLHAD